MEILPMSAISAPGKYLAIADAWHGEHYGAALRLPDDLSAETYNELDSGIAALESAELLPAEGFGAIGHRGRFLIDTRGDPVGRMYVDLSSFWDGGNVLMGLRCLDQQWADYAATKARQPHDLSSLSW